MATAISDVLVHIGQHPKQHVVQILDLSIRKGMTGDTSGVTMALLWCYYGDTAEFIK
jgi:hypothetical protein